MRGRPTATLPAQPRSPLMGKSEHRPADDPGASAEKGPMAAPHERLPPGPLVTQIGTHRMMARQKACLVHHI